MENWNSLLLELAKKATEAGQDVYAFILEQSPELVKEVIFWGILENGISAAFNLLWAALILIGFYILYRALKKNKWFYWDDDVEMITPWSPVFMVLLFPIVYLVTCFSDFTDNTKQAAKAYFTPRIYMIEYTSDLINKNNK